MDIYANLFKIMDKTWWKGYQWIRYFVFIISGGRVKFNYQKEDSKWDWTLKGKCCLSKGLIVYETEKADRNQLPRRGGYPDS